MTGRAEVFATKFPFTNCSKEPRMEAPPSPVVASFGSDLVATPVSLAGEPGSEVGVLRKRGLPTHCWMCGMKMSMGIFSSQRSQGSFPLSMISFAEIGLWVPATSCRARSSSNS